MLHARVLRPPTYEAKLLGLEKSRLKKSVAKDIKLINDGSFLALVGPDEYQVEVAIKKLREAVTWSSAKALPEQENLKDLLVEKSSESQEVINEGSIEEAQAGITKIMGTFYKPYIMHGSIGPACGIAHYEEGKMQVWTHSQGVFPFRSALSSMLHLAESDIHVIGVPGAGCFGHNSADDAAADAAIIARKIPGRHIRVQWSRNQEHSWEAFGSAMRIDIEAGMTKEGKIAFWKTEVYTDSHSTRPNKDAGTLIPARYLEKPTPLASRGYLGGGYRNAEPYYPIANKNIQAHFFDGPLRVSSLRSLGAYTNIFAIESIIDEMSLKHNIHPLDFRINLVADERAIDVMLKLRKMTTGVVTGVGECLGFAFSRYKNNDAYCAVAVHLSVSEEKKINLIKMWAVIDAGEVINQDGLANQTEGGMIQAASWTLMEEVKFNAEHITSQDWATYPILRYQHVPEVEVAVMPRQEDPPLGGGEAAQPPTPAAITNAIFQATGTRIYELPVQGKI
jgi:CO/xanthine dehydrogenase Mo-binding subunit